MDILSRVDILSRGVDILSNLLIWGEGGHFVHHRIIEYNKNIVRVCAKMPILKRHFASLYRFTA